MQKTKKDPAGKCVMLAYRIFWIERSWMTGPLFLLLEEDYEALEETVLAFLGSEFQTTAPITMAAPIKERPESFS